METKPYSNSNKENKNGDEIWLGYFSFYLLFLMLVLHPPLPAGGTIGGFSFL